MLRRGNGVDRAGIDAGTTIDTGIWIDVVLTVPLADCVDRAGIHAASAVCAVVGNHMSHDLFHPFRSWYAC